MNKEDELSGLRSIEHLVDTVLYIEGEKGESLNEDSPKFDTAV